MNNMIFENFLWKSKYNYVELFKGKGYWGKYFNMRMKKEAFGKTGSLINGFSRLAFATKNGWKSVTGGQFLHFGPLVVVTWWSDGASWDLVIAVSQ